MSFWKVLLYRVLVRIPLVSYTGSGEGDLQQGEQSLFLPVYGVQQARQLNPPVLRVDWDAEIGKVEPVGAVADPHLGQVQLLLLVLQIGQVNIGRRLHREFQIFETDNF